MPREYSLLDLYAPLVNRMPGMVFCVNIVHSEPDRYVHLFFDLKCQREIKSIVYYFEVDAERGQAVDRTQWI